jgi:hypothetical protein
MQKLAKFIKGELLEVLPVTLFFCVAFNVITLTKRLILEQYGIEVAGFMAATVGALIVGKVVVLADQIPFINKYPEKPLIYNVVWKTGVYLLVSLIVRFLEALLLLGWQYRDLGLALDKVWASIIWAHFWAVQIWLLCLFFVYVSFRELARTLGEAKFLQMFLGIKV